MTPLALLFTLAFLVSVDVRILGPVLPSIAASLGATPGPVVGVAMTSYRWPWPVVALSMLMLGLGFVGLHSKFGSPR